MKHSIHIFTLIFLFLAQACQNKGGDGMDQLIKPNLSLEATKIKNVLHLQEQAWNIGSIDSFMMGYWNDDRLKFISRRGETYGYQKVLSNYKKGYPNKDRMGALSFEIEDVYFLDSSSTIAQVTGVYHLQREQLSSEQKDSGYFSLIFRKIQSDWKIIIDHTF